ncbi:MAG: LysR family transcriptional regulator [Limosilactobacillus sp.]|jgi:DNA-binding transcriptional LysR family regulator|uniref:LysR family transcriptional regulator n=1 Tax=Limosilactobacillus sp. TaxID=2773925 RepID=UPI0025C4CC85|nr:LysR family transcriptional regulator [Limosilactobacillus sp.]MCI1974554.1 LysR family transcriptional regulator [Limosilactobacillus sp.]MCI2031559.1 LysR family transcriptional regulator [Limosilactobacillus sp.]
MKIKDLEYFIELVKKKNFSVVAEHFHVSQPTITMAINRLEEEYGTTFFVRDHVHHQIEVTRIGQQYAQHVRTILNELTVAREEIENAKLNKIRFGLPPIIGNYYFPPLTPELLRARLIDKLEVTEAGSESLLQMLLRGELDMALLGSASSLQQPELLVKELDQYPFQIIMSRDNQLADRAALSFSDLKGQQFILPDADFIHEKAFRKMCRGAHIRPQVIYRTNDIHIIKNMVAENLGISFLTKLAITPNDRLVNLSLTDQGQPLFHLSLVARHNEILSPAKKKLWDLVLKYAASK